MIDATTYYVFGSDVLDAEDTTGFDPDDLTAVVHRRDYDELRDLTENLAASAKEIIELEERRATLRAEIGSTARTLISAGLQERNKQLIADALKLLDNLTAMEKKHVGQRVQG